MAYPTPEAHRDAAALQTAAQAALQTAAQAADKQATCGSQNPDIKECPLCGGWVDVVDGRITRHGASYSSDICFVRAPCIVLKIIAERPNLLQPGPLFDDIVTLAAKKRAEATVGGCENAAEYTPRATSGIVARANKPKVSITKELELITERVWAAVSRLDQIETHLLGKESQLEQGVGSAPAPKSVAESLAWIQAACAQAHLHLDRIQAGL